VGGGTLTGNLQIDLDGEFLTLKNANHLSSDNLLNSWIRWKDSAGTDMAWIGFGSNSNNDLGIYHSESGKHIRMNTVGAGDVLMAMGATGALEITGSSYKTNPTGLRLGQYSSTIGYLQAPANGKVVIWNDTTVQIAGFNDDLSVDFAGPIVGEDGIYGTPGNTWGTDVLHVGHQLPGATHDSTSASVTGYCRIRSPVSTTNDNVMMNMMIHGYNYSGTNGTLDGGAWCIQVGGYGYSTENWHNTSARIVSGSPPFDRVWFGEDETGDYKYILLGTSTTQWDYPKVFITDFCAGHSTQTAWFGDWLIDFSASTPSGWSGDATAGLIYLGGQIRWDGETGSHAASKNSGGRITISTSAASGGQDGDIHFKY
jgi:hypothetical protein